MIVFSMASFPSCLVVFPFFEARRRDVALQRETPTARRKPYVRPCALLERARWPLEPGAALPEHGELRPAAPPAFEALQEALARVAARPHELGGLDRVGRPGAGELRPARRLPHRGRRRRRHGLRARRPGRRLAAGGARVLVPEIEFTSNLFPWLAQEHRGVEVRTAPLNGSPRRSSARPRSCGQRRAVVERRGRRPRRRRARPPARTTRSCSSTRRRPAAGSRSTPPTATSSCAHVQMADVPARRGADGGATGAAGGADAHPRRLVGRREPARRLLRTAAPARRTGARLDTLARVVLLGGAAPTLELVERIGVERIHEHDVGAREPLPRRAWASSRATRRSSRSTWRTAAAKLERAGIRAAVRAGGLRVSFHLYNTAADVDAALDALR